MTRFQGRAAGITVGGGKYIRVGRHVLSGTGGGNVSGRRHVLSGTGDRLFSDGTLSYQGMATPNFRWGTYTKYGSYGFNIHL